MEPGNFSRADVRKIAEKHASELDKTAQAGGNPHQKALDLQDEIDLMIKDWSDDEKNKLQKMYNDEINALVAKVNADTEQVLLDAQKAQAKKDAEVAFDGTVLSIIVIVCGLVFLFMYMDR